MEDVEGVNVDNGEAIPLVIHAVEEKDSVDYLKKWVTKNRSWLDAKMLEHGAILLKGFTVDSGREFQEVIQCYNPELSNKYRGTSPRKLVPGTDYVFTASELPQFYPIPQHLEMSFLPSPPRKLFFCCLDPPTSAGGETCLCDYKKVYQQLDPNIRKQFVEKGVLHIRNYEQKKSLISDPGMMKGWMDVFGTESQEEVSRELQEQELDYSWKENGDLQILNKTSAVEKHPETGDTIWFNHLMVFHWSNFYQEYYRIWRRLGEFKYLFLSILMWLLSFFFLDVWGRDRVGTHTEFGDGSSIPRKTVAHVRDVVWKNLVFNRWEKGDILLIDNFRVSHGRQPYSGRRKIVVAWSSPLKRPSLQN